MLDVVVAGRGPRVVLVHGSMDRGAGFARCLRHLRGFEVVRYDRRGYGRSVEAGIADLDGHVADLLDVIGGRPATVVGHSFGGVVALTGAARHPDLATRVGAFEPPAPWLPWWPSPPDGDRRVAATDPGGAAERFLRRMVGDGRWERLPARVRAARRAEGPAFVADVAALRGAAPFAAEQVAVPVLLGYGSGTSRAHRRAVEELAAALPAATVEVVDGAGHGAHLSHPAQFAAFVRRAAGLAS